MLNLSKKNYKKVGILGGTFDPPHVGHLHIAKAGIKKLKLNKLIWVVTKKNNLKKKPYLDLKTRVKLSRMITKREKKIFVKYFENQVRSNSSFNLLNYIKNKNKRTRLYFLIGADNLVRLHKWNSWKKIPKLAKIVVFARQNYSIKALNSIAAKKINKKDWIYINLKKVNISSSLIRKF